MKTKLVIGKMNPVKVRRRVIVKKKRDRSRRVVAKKKRGRIKRAIVKKRRDKNRKVIVKKTLSRAWF